MDKSKFTYDHRLDHMDQLAFFGRARWAYKLMKDNWKEAKIWIAQHPNPDSLSQHSQQPTG